VILGFAIIFIVLIFLISILLQRQDLRNRFVRLAGSADIQRTTAALDEAGGRLSKLFQTQLALNAAFGVAIGVGLQLTALGAGHLIRNAPNVTFFTSGQGPLLSAAIFPLSADCLRLCTRNKTRMTSDD
jgi:hypothetical protein